MKALLNLFGSGTMIKGIDHVAIVVSDMDRSIEYYSGVLGLKILHDGRGEGGDKKSFLGTESRTLIALTEDEDRANKSPGYVEGVHHVAFSVDDVERTRKILEDKGVEFIQEKLDKDKKKAYHFLDPDGLELEIYGESGEAVPPY